jgi:hypothetical protein
MNILTKRNGIALIAVLSILLVLTLLLPLMFSMSENAMEAAMTGTDEQRASYLARSMIEFTVGAFQSCYDAAEEDEANGFKIPDEGEEIPDKLKETDLYKLHQFLKVSKSMEVSVIYMYRNPGINYPEGGKPLRNAGESDAEYRSRCLQAYNEYMEKGVIYSTTLPSGYSQIQAEKGEIPEGTLANVTYFDRDGNAHTVNGEYVGFAKCSVRYDDSTEYFKTWPDANGVWQTKKIEDANAADQYDAYLARAKSAIGANSSITTTENNPQIFRVQNRNVVFVSNAVINGKGAQKRCLLVLPTKPAENNWIVPANIESGHRLLPL